MNNVLFLVKKWTMRALMATGAMLGLSSCFHAKNGPSSGPPECVYGPPPGMGNRVEVIEDVYGPPPVEDVDSAIDSVATQHVQLKSIQKPR